LSASNRSLELAYEVHQGSIPTIASGGVLSGRDVLEKILRGASAVQIYTALVYRGADVVSVLLDELWEAMRNAGFTSLEEAQSALVK
jgi:dihydroorotate dehydrogenase